MRSIFARRSRGISRRMQDNLEGRAAGNEQRQADVHRDPRVESSGRKRGRSAVFARSAKSQQLGWLVKHHEITAILCKLGFAKTFARTCVSSEKKDWKLEIERIHVWCDSASADVLKVSLRKTETFFCKRIYFRSAVGCLWLMCTLELSLNQAGLMLGLDSRTVRKQ